MQIVSSRSRLTYTDSMFAVTMSRNPVARLVSSFKVVLRRSNLYMFGWASLFIRVWWLTRSSLRECLCLLADAHPSIHPWVPLLMSLSHTRARSDAPRVVTRTIRIAGISSHPWAVIITYIASAFRSSSKSCISDAPNRSTQKAHPTGNASPVIADLTRYSTTASCLSRPLATSHSGLCFDTSGSIYCPSGTYMPRTGTLVATQPKSMKRSTRLTADNLWRKFVSFTERSLRGVTGTHLPQRQSPPRYRRPPYTGLIYETYETWLRKSTQYMQATTPCITTPKIYNAILTSFGIFSMINQVLACFQQHWRITLKERTRKMHGNIKLFD